MDKKIMFVLIALLGIGLYALPSTVALFSGQHTFVNIDATGNQIACEKCHGDVRAELGDRVGRADMTTLDVAPHSGFKCEYCHRIEAGAASGDNAYAIVTYRGTGTPAPMRTIAMTIENFEEENFPATIQNSNGATATTLVQAAPSTTWIGGAAISPAVTGTETVIQDLTIYNEYIKSTYNAATGQPYDTSALKYDGLKLAALTMDTLGWTSGSRYWTPTLLNAGSRAVNPGTEYHAASLVSCLECHGGFEPLGHYSRVLDDTDPLLAGGNDAKCYGCHYGYTNRVTTLAAGGFGITGGADTGVQEAHMEFQKTDDAITEYKTVGTAGYSNGACIACHTHVSATITYQKPSFYKFDANFFSDGTEGVGGFSAEVPVTSCSNGGTPPCTSP